MEEASPPERETEGAAGVSARACPQCSSGAHAHSRPEEAPGQGEDAAKLTGRPHGARAPGAGPHGQAEVRARQRRRRDVHFCSDRSSSLLVRAVHSRRSAEVHGTAAEARDERLGGPRQRSAQQEEAPVSAAVFSTQPTSDSSFSSSSGACGGPYLTREKLLRRQFGAVPEHNKSSESLSSATSLAPSETAAGAAIALEQGLMSSTTFSSSAVLTDDKLVSVARRAKKQLESVSKRQVMVGRWKHMARSKPDCQMFESVSKAKDQYSVVAKMNLPCSLREIMSVFSTDNAAEFHRSMEAVFGDQYVYGVNVRTVDCNLYVGAGNAALHPHAQARRASEPATWRISEGSSSCRIPLFAPPS